MAVATPARIRDGAFSGLGLVGYDARLTRERSRVRPSELVLHGTLAEWLRRMIRNHMGVARVGSSPTRVVLFLLFASQAVSLVVQ